MKREQTTIRLPAETNEFIKILKKLDEKQQIGLNMVIEGFSLLSDSKKAVKNR